MRIKFKLNVPNILTLLRFVLVPIAVIYVLKGRLLSGFFIYAAACITDGLDGFVARRYNMITEIGMLLDPLADKCMTMSLIITFTVLDVLPVFVCVYVIIKEVLMVIGGIVLFKHEIVTRANIYGKIAAVLFYLALAFTFFHVYLSKLYLYMMYLAMAFSLVAFIQYFYVNIYRTFCNPKKENDKPDMLNKKLN